MDWPVERTATAAAGQGDGVLSDLNFGEVFPFVAKPLVRDVLAQYAGPLLNAQLAGLRRHDPLLKAINPIAFVAGRPYMDLSAYFTIPAVRYNQDSLESADHAKGSIILSLARSKRLRPLPLPLYSRVRLHLAGARLGLQSVWWLLRLETPTALLAAYAQTADRLRRSLNEPLDASSPALLAELDRRWKEQGEPTDDGLRHLGLTFFLHHALKMLCGSRVSSTLLDDLGKGIPHNFTTAVSVDLWELAREARPLVQLFEQTPVPELPARLRASEEGQRWWTSFERFLARHGHRGEVEMDLATPRWREDPTFLLQTVMNYLRHPEDGAGPAEKLTEGARRREAAAKAIRAELWPPLRPVFGWLYRRYVPWMPFREAAKYVWLLGLEFMRRVYLELGRRLVQEGHLLTIDHVFWVRMDELVAWATSGRVSWTRELLNERQREWAHWNTLRPPPVLIGSEAVTGALTVKEAALAPMSSTMLLHGTPASAGYAEGVARVIIDPHEADLRPGEVLVTCYTDPAWTPLFITAAALVTEVGGILSHGAVIARELSLPAIVGVHEATRHIRSGQRLRVNATEGTVEVLN